MNHLPFFSKILRSPFFIFLIFFLFVSFSTTGSHRDISWAQEFPSREIKLVVTHGAGGGVDLPARMFAGKAEKILGVPIVVVNNTAGGGVVGALSVIQAKPDGYTILYTVTGVVILKELLTPNLPFRHTDFLPICRAAVMPVAIFAQNEAPWKSLKELIDDGKKNPGKVRAAVATGGGFMEVLMNLFKVEAGVNITDIPTKGGISQSAALLGGHAELCVDTIVNNVGFLRAGRLRALVSTHKISEFPMVKTFEEEGYPGVSLKLWHGFYGPKGLPTPILTKWTKTLEKAINDPSLVEQLGKQYILPDYRIPEETSKLIESEREVTLKILKQSGMIK